MGLFIRLLLMLLAGAFAGCTSSSRNVQAKVLDTRPAGTRLSLAKVIRIAKQTAQLQGRNLRDYQEPEAHYEFTRKDSSWSVFFDGRIPMPGNHFLVTVDDRTGEAVLQGGE
jgi:hypothetical protein